MDDLDNVSPVGRLDVAGYRVAEYLTKKLEEQYQVKGVWDALKPHASKAMGQLLGGIEVPVEAKVIMAIINANYKGEP